MYVGKRVSNAYVTHTYIHFFKYTLAKNEKYCPSDFSTVLICICRLPRSINVYEAKASVILAHLSTWNTHVHVDMHMEFGIFFPFSYYPAKTKILNYF